jgi:crotonobetainyl-CoA:carnitine CoA-transferase CaiB-like acyl-CoA transferase
LLQDVPSERHKDLRLVAPPLSFAGERLRLRTAPPALGEHSAEILSELGYDVGDIQDLCNRGVIETPQSAYHS